jgi:hypothetical protein
MIAVAIVIAGVLISASLFIAIGQATKTSTSTTTVTDDCLAAGGSLPSIHFPFLVSINYSGPWKATLSAFSNSAPAFTQCYAGDAQGYIVLNDWNPNGSALLAVSAQKLDAGSGNLSLWVESDTTGVNLTTGTNSTVAPHGSVTASAGLPPFSSISTSTQVQTNALTLTSISNSVEGINGLTFRLTANISTSSLEVTVSAVAGEYNLQASAANVTAADTWSVPEQVLQSHFCTPPDRPVGVSIAQGHYTLSNVSSAKFLIFINPAVTYTCTVQAPEPVTTYTFSPMSDAAVARGSCGSLVCGYDTTASDQLVASGSYVGGALTGFAPGAYTIVAGDEWGNSLLAYFTVP